METTWQPEKDGHWREGSLLPVGVEDHSVEESPKCVVAGLLVVGPRLNEGGHLVVAPPQRLAVGDSVERSLVRPGDGGHLVVAPLLRPVSFEYSNGDPLLCPVKMRKKNDKGVRSCEVGPLSRVKTWEEGFAETAHVGVGTCCQVVSEIER